MKPLKPAIGYLLLLLAIIMLAACGSFGKSDQELVQSARNYLQQDDLRAAAIELKNALQKNPDNAQARYLLGAINLRLGDSPAAEKEFRSARKAGWDQGEATIGEARALLGQHAYHKLLDQIRVADTLAATSRASLLAMRATAQAGTEHPEQARQTLAKASQLDADNARVLLTRAQVALTAGDAAKAANTLAKALKQYPDDPELLLLRAGLAARNNKPSQAKRDYQRIIDADPPKIITAFGRQARLGLARLQLLAGDLESAKDNLATLLKRNGNDPQANYLGGVLASQQQDYELAEQRLLKVLKVAPDNSQAHLVYGTVKYHRHDYEQAEYYLTKAVHAFPGNRAASKMLAKSDIKLGKPKAALKLLQQSSAQGDDDAETQALIGYSQLGQGNLQAGTAGLEQAVQASPESGGLRTGLARVYLATGKTDRAIQELQTLLSEGYQQQRTGTLLVLAHLRAGETDQAIDKVQALLQANPEDARLNTLVGRVYLAAGKRAEARKYLQKAREIEPHQLLASMLLAGMEKQDDHPAQAKELYKELVDADTKSILPRLALAHMAEQQGDTDAMLDWLRKARQQAPDNAVPRLFLAKYYLQSQQLDKAEQNLTEALKIEPESPRLLLLQGRVLMARQQYVDALTPLEKLVKLAPQAGKAHILLAQTYLRLQRTGNAREQLAKVLEQRPKAVPALAQMARVEIQAGNYAKADDYSRRIRQAKPDLAIGYELAGDTWMARRDYQKAARHYADAWERRPGSGLAIKRYQAASQAGDDPQQAMQPMLDWIDRHPEDSGVQGFLGLAYQNTGNKKEAIKAYKKAIDNNPRSKVALNNLAWLYLQQDKPGALDLSARAYQIDSEDPGIRDTYGWALVKDGQINKGLRLLRSAAQLLPKQPDVQYHYAVALFKAGRKQEALDRLGTLLDNNPSFEGRAHAARLMEQAGAGQ